MKYIFYLLSLFIIGCQPKSAKEQPSLVTEYILDPKSEKREIWEEYSIKDSIPKVLLKKLNELSGNNFEVANPKENFNATDNVLDEKLPWRQLRYLGKYENFWIMTYKHGGIGLHYHFVICQIIKDKIRVFRTGVAVVDLETMVQIKKALTNQEIEFKEIEAKEVIDKI